MKLWVGGEISAEVADSFRLARETVEKAINEVIANKSYDVELNAWDCIAILRDDDAFKEIVKYSPKKKEVDFRLKISFEKFRAASGIQRETLIFEMLVRSLELMKEKGVKGQGLEGLIEDVRTVGSTRGWLAVTRH